MDTPILETERLVLRPFCIGDAKDVFKCWESDPEVAKYMFWSSHNDPEKTKRWVEKEVEKIKDDKWYRFAIVLKDTNELIGTGLIYYEDEVANWEIGYNLGRKFWGKGYITEAMKCILDFAKEQLAIKQVIGRYAQENPASGNVMKKLGFHFEREIPYDCNQGTIHRKGIMCSIEL